MSEHELDQQASGRRIPVTIEDIQGAIDRISDGNPNATNASAIRTELGRGSLTTIQKFLDKLRDEKCKSEALPEVEEGVEPMPEHVRAEMRELFTLMEGVATRVWGTASAMAKNGVYAHLSAVTAERDSLKTRIETALADRDAMCAMAEAKDLELEAAGEEARLKAVEVEAEKAALVAVLEDAHGEIEGLKNQAAALVAERLATVKEMEHQAETASLKWEVERQTVRSMNEDLNGKLRDAEVERDKILARIKEIQSDADARVKAIEAEATRVREKLQEMHREEMTRTQDKAAKALTAVEHKLGSATLEADAARKEAESLKAELAALKAKVTELEKATVAPKKEKKA